MGMVFQHFNLFPHLTVLENVIEAPQVVQGISRESIVPEAELLLSKVGLLEKRMLILLACRGDKSNG
jgi:polar amino acid transport system ATP-binding protein